MLIITNILLIISINTNNTILNCLYNKNIDIVSKSYWEIVNKPDKYRNDIYRELVKYKKKKIPDKLIYLSTVIKDKRYLNILYNNYKVIKYDCIYSCPIIFSLVIYKCFSNYWSDSFSINDDDFNSTVDYINNFNIENIYEINNIELEKNIDKASIGHTYDERYYSVDWLKDNINTSKYNKQLYYLAVTEYKDASYEYRYNVYQTIYRAEYIKYKLKK